jgi:hypothetical protein
MKKKDMLTENERRNAIIKILNSHKSKVEYIDMNYLHTGLFYQFPPDKDWVNFIATHFSWKLFERMFVSKRDGQYNVVEGQHRLFGARLKFADSKKPIRLECLVIYDLTKEQESELFKLLAMSKRHVKTIELMKADYGANDTTTVNMINAINDVGLIFDYNKSQIQNRITSTSAITDLYNDLGEYDFKILLRLIKNTWNGHPVSLQEFMLRGMYEFYKKYKFQYNEKTFIKKLKDIAPNEIKAFGKSRGSKGYERYAVVIREKYNYDLRNKSNRLDDNIW